MGAGILPVAIYNNQIFLLLGKEHVSGSWSDFGGGREKGESLNDTAIREGVEELNGFLGNESDMKKLLKQQTLGIVTTDKPVYKCFMIKIPYDPYLPGYFNSNFKLMNRKLKNTVEKHNGLFEKSEIMWIPLNKVKNFRLRRYFHSHVFPKILEFFSHYKV